LDIRTSKAGELIFIITGQADIMKPSKSQKVKYLIFLLCLIFIIIDITLSISTIYDLFRIFIYGIAVNFLTDYIVNVKKRGKK